MQGLVTVCVGTAAQTVLGVLVGVHVGCEGKAFNADNRWRIFRVPKWGIRRVYWKQANCMYI